MAHAFRLAQARIFSSNNVNYDQTKNGVRRLFGRAQCRGRTRGLLYCVKKPQRQPPQQWVKDSLDENEIIVCTILTIWRRILVGYIRPMPLVTERER